jgi:serine/threonine protein kinase
MPPSVGRYRVEGLLGQGGFGRVYLAHDDQLRRRVAVKVPHRRHHHHHHHHHRGPAADGPARYGLAVAPAPS